MTQNDSQAHLLDFPGKAKLTLSFVKGGIFFKLVLSLQERDNMQSPEIKTSNQNNEDKQEKIYFRRYPV